MYTMYHVLDKYEVIPSVHLVTIIYLFETGHWLTIDQNDRIEKMYFCQLNEVGEDFHYLFKCQHFNNIKEATAT